MSARIQAFTYEIALPILRSREETKGKVEEFLSSPSFQITKVHKGKNRTRDLRQLVIDVSVTESALSMTVKADQSGSVHPLDAFSAVLGLTREEVKCLRIVKTSVTFE